MPNGSEAKLRRGPVCGRQRGATLAATNDLSAGSVCKRRDAVTLGRKKGLQPRASERPAGSFSFKLGGAPRIFRRVLSEEAYVSQHTLPRTYLNAWRDPATPNGAYVWVFNRDGSAGHYSSPKKLFAEDDFYTIVDEDSGRDVRLEQDLRKLEDRFAKVRDKRLIHDEPVTTEDRACLFEFMIAMSFRTPAHRRRRRAEWQNVFDSMLAAQRDAGQDRLGRPPSIRYSFSPDRAAPSLSIDDVRRLADSPIQHSFTIEMSTYLPLMASMEMLIFRTDDPVGFITSDDPCVWINDSVNQGPPKLRDLGTFGVLMPLSPRQILFLNPFQSGYARLESVSVLDEFNRLTCEHASEKIIVCRNETRPEWFATNPS